MKLIKRCLDEFVKASGQKINLEKSKLYFSSNTSKEAARISCEARIPVTEGLGKYLRAQFVHRRHWKAMCTALIDKYKQRMDGWKTKCLSLAGRITLANSVLTSLPVFHMQTSILHASMTKEMDKLVRRCIWGSMEGQRNGHLVNWNIVCKAKEEGGLGVRRASEVNQALMAKLDWCMLNEMDALWSQTLLSKYGQGREGFGVFEHKHGSYHIWRGLVHNSKVL